MSSPLDDLWERTKKRYPQLADWDVIRDQSQTHHTLNIGLGFGNLGVLVSFVSASTYAQGWAAGIAGGVVGYLVRERWPFVLLKRTDKTTPAGRAAKWDGVVDVTVPASRLLPFAIACVLLSVPWWLVLVQQVLLAGEALGYSFLRPRGTLFYGGDGTRYWGRPEVTRAGVEAADLVGMLVYAAGGLVVLSGREQEALPRLTIFREDRPDGTVIIHAVEPGGARP